MQVRSIESSSESKLYSSLQNSKSLPPLPSTTPHSPCEDGSVSNNAAGATSCSVCGINQISNYNHTVCVSQSGFFFDLDENNIATTVKEVPSGVSTESVGMTITTLELMPGYWRSNDKSEEIISCQREGEKVVKEQTI